MKTNFESRLEDIAQEALDFLKKNVTLNKKFVFLTNKEKDEDIDKMYELPIASKVTKHGFYDEFAVSSVKNKNGELVFYGICKGEGDDNAEIAVEDISNTNLCAIADLVSKKL